LNQKKGYIAATCILCGAEIDEDQCNPSDSTMHLCLNCGHRSGSLPDIFAISIERFLIGNVL
jgi:ribosome-binding protein aMBF1 (putative translation factor)